MIAHVSAHAEQYNESLSTLQLASRLYHVGRMQPKVCQGAMRDKPIHTVTETVQTLMLQVSHTAIQNQPWTCKMEGLLHTQHVQQTKYQKNTGQLS